MKIGTTLIALVGWGLDAQQREAGRRRHLDAVRTLMEKYALQAVELNGDFSVLYPQVFGPGYYDQVAALQREMGFACTLHLPFLWQDGASLAEPLRQTTVQSIRQVLEWTQALELESYVLHLWGLWTSVLASVQQMPAEEKQLLMDQLLRQAARTLEELAACVPPGKLCVENLERFPFDYIVPLIDEQGMRICLDVGHLTLQGGDPLTFLREHWERIGEIHLHDAVRGGSAGPGVRDHLPLGDGGVDYVAFMDTLSAQGYDEVLILEVNTKEDLLQSLERIQPWR